MAWEWLEKYLKGTTTPKWDYMEQPHSGIEKFGAVAPEITKGLFGTGGEYGTGGLLTTFNQPSDPGKGMLDLFSNLPAVTGMEIIQKGFEGKPIEQTLMPAFKSGLTTTSAVEKVKASKRKQKFIKDYKDQVPEKDMELFLAFPEKYVGGLIGKKFRTTKRTLSDEVLEVYDKVKGLDTDTFNKVWKTLSKSEKWLFNNKIKGNEDYFEALITGKMEELNTPIVLDDTGAAPNSNELTKHQIYQIGIDAKGNPKYYRWDGEDMKLIPPPQ